MNFFDTATRARGWRTDMYEAVLDVARSDDYILKSRTAELEAEIADRISIEHAVACASGTGALQLSLMALGVGTGKRVITPAYSFIASASTIVLASATPVFVDVDPQSATIDPAAAAARASEADAVMAVHLFSAMADMAALRPLAEQGLTIIEDSAISLGASQDGRAAGTLGDIGVFSFFPGKPLGGVGDGGMVVTSDEQTAVACRELRNHGQDLTTRFLYRRVGLNCRMDEITAAFLLRRLRVFDDVLARRRLLAGLYHAGLTEVNAEVSGAGRDGHIGLPSISAATAPHIFAIEVEDRAALRAHLSERGVASHVYYPRPLPYHPAFRQLGHAPGDFPVAERLAARMLALPLHEEMEPEAIATVVAHVRDFYLGRP